MIGEAGVPHDDVSYTGDEGDSYFGMQKYRNQAAEFQSVMDAMDSTANALRGLLQLPLAAEDYASVQSDLNEFESRKLAFRAAAETINAVGYAINAAGGRFPVLQVPAGLQGIAGSLGLGPAIPIAAIAALATAATLVSWGRDWMASVTTRRSDEQLLAAIEDPAQRAEAAERLLQMREARAQSETSTLSKVATIAKWGLFAMLAYYGYRMWENQ